MVVENNLIHVLLYHTGCSPCIDEYPLLNIYFMYLFSTVFSLQHEKQELEGNNTELQCTVLALEKSVSAAKEEGVYLAETHQHTLDKERYNLFVLNLDNLCCVLIE